MFLFSLLMTFSQPFRWLFLVSMVSSGQTACKSTTMQWLDKPLMPSATMTLDEHLWQDTASIVGNYFSICVDNNPTLALPVTDGFDYPFGEKSQYTQRNDGDGWYNIQDFRRNRHMGEDWNREGGASRDCGEPVLACADGLVIYSAAAHKSWGNVVIVRHRLPSGEQVETFYAHVQSRGMIPYLSQVKRRQRIAFVGDGADPCGDSRPYAAHLHFEVHTPKYKMWGNIGHGYDNDANAVGALDPSDFIDAHRK